MRTKSVEEFGLFRRQKGFTFVELLMVMIILGILAGISIPNFLSYKDKAEYAAVRTTLKHLMDGEDFYLFENSSFYPGSGNVNIPQGTAKDIPELAYSFPGGHKNQYTIRGTNNSSRNYYRIDVRCDFDANRNGKDDRYIVITDIRSGDVRQNRSLVSYNNSVRGIGLKHKFTLSPEIILITHKLFPSKNKILYSLILSRLFHESH